MEDKLGLERGGQGTESLGVWERQLKRPWTGNLVGRQLGLTRCHPGGKRFCPKWHMIYRQSAGWRGRSSKLESGEEVLAEFGKEEMDWFKESRETTWRLHKRREMIKWKIMTGLSTAEFSRHLNTKPHRAEYTHRSCFYMFCFYRSCRCVFYW